MKTRVVLTTLFVLVRVIFLHVRISVGIFFTTIFFFTLRGLRRFDRLRHRKVIVSVCTFSFVSASVFWHAEVFPTKKNLIDQESILGSTFIGTGQITELHRTGRYVMSSESGTYLLRSTSRVELGDDIWVAGKFTPAKPIEIQTKPIFSQRSFPALFTGGFDYPQWLQMKGLRGEIRASQLVIIPSDQGGRSIVGFRKDVLEYIEKTYGKGRASGLLQGMLIGDRSSIPPESYEQFISSGLVHIVAVSGSNILYLVVLLHALLFFLPYYLRISIIIPLIIFYALLCGLDSSVVRAVIMGCMGLLALIGGRVVSIWRLLGVAWVSMLIRNPRLLLFDLGFLLSFSALAGIVLLAEKTENRQPKKKTIKLFKAYTIPSLGAGRGVLPVLIFFTGETNLLSMIGNIFIVPVVPIVLFRGVVAVVIDSIFSLTLYIDILRWPFETIYWLARLLSENGLYLSTSVWRSRHLVVGLLVVISRWIFRRPFANKSKKPST